MFRKSSHTHHTFLTYAKDHLFLVSHLRAGPGSLRKDPSVCGALGWAQRFLLDQEKVAHPSDRQTTH